MNPYASQLGSREPVQVIENTADRIQRLWNALPADRRNAPVAPGKWSPREVLCHLADTEIVWAFRLRQSLAEAHHIIQPMDQTVWAEQYRAYDGADALSLLLALRRWNVSLIRQVVPAALDKPLTHPERGPMTYRVLLETMAGHDLHHVAQLEKLTGQ